MSEFGKMEDLLISTQSNRISWKESAINIYDKAKEYNDTQIVEMARLIEIIEDFGNFKGEKCYCGEEFDPQTFESIENKYLHSNLVEGYEHERKWFCPNCMEELAECEGCGKMCNPEANCSGEEDLFHCENCQENEDTQEVGIDIDDH